MGWHSDVKAARIAAEKTTNTAPTTANHAQMARLARLEVKLGEAKVLAAEIVAAGGLSDSASNTDLNNLIASL